MSGAGPSTAPGSDDDIQMLDSNGDALPSSTSTTVAATADTAIAVDDNDDAANSGDGSGDEAEDEYEIEHIVSHYQDTENNQLSYFVKWKGYPESDNTWVYESDMGGAQEMIAEYWAKAPEKRVKKMGTKGGKKGKRQSSVAASPAAKASGSALSAAKKASRRESSTAERKSRRSAADQPSRSPTPDDQLIDVEHDPALQRIRSDPSLTEEERSVLEAQHLHTITIDRLRKRYARIADWDPIVKKVEAVEKMSNDKLRVFLLFENGDRLAFESVVAHHRCPLKLLAFYETNLRFKRSEEEGGRREMRGEEGTVELEAWRTKEGLNGDTQTTTQAEGTQETAEAVEGAVEGAVEEAMEAAVEAAEANGVEGEASTVDSQLETQTAAEEVDAHPTEAIAEDAQDSAAVVAASTVVVDQNGTIEQVTETVEA